MSETQQQPILMCYGKTPYTPGSYLERALRQIGIPVDVIHKEVDFSKVDSHKYRAVLFVESPSLASITVKHRDLVNIPVLFWIHHGENKLARNLELAKRYQPQLILMSHSLHLAGHFSVPVKFFPFATDPHIFSSTIPLSKRTIDVAFVGAHGEGYENREANLRFLEKSLRGQAVFSFRKRLFLEKLSTLYGNSKVVFNETHDTIKSFNMRIFEAMGCGSLVLTNETPEQNKLFQDGKHYVIFNSQEDLLAKLRYYLNHLGQAEKIAEAGQKAVLDSHTYEHRARELISLIENL